VICPKVAADKEKLLLIIIIIIIIMLCKDKIQKQAGMVFTLPPPSQNYQEVE